MGTQTTQGFNLKLVANGTELDLFEDEVIRVSDNITGVFDVDKLPSDFVRNITLPGSKKNNDFFEHVYDISITNPYLFATNIKVDAYLDLDGFYIADGYLQLNKVNVKENKFIESYEVSLFGSVSAFARETSRNYITDLTTLAEYNHTASYSAISASWEGDLFNGDIVYPLADYGEGIEFATGFGEFGFNRSGSALTVQDFKPAIRLKALWDGIFEQYGYTYSSSFFDQEWLDNVYVIANRELEYPEFSGIQMEGYGVVKFSNQPSDTGYPMSIGVDETLTWSNVIKDDQGFMDGYTYTLPITSSLSGRFKLNFNVSGSSGMPQFTLKIKNGVTELASMPLEKTNSYLRQLETVQAVTGDQDLTIEEEWYTDDIISPQDLEFSLSYSAFGSTGFDVTLAPNNNTDSYIAIDKVRQSADGRIMRIADNLPFGTEGVLQSDFIRSIQKKFNLVIYPSKTQNKTFIIETFNDWYKNGEVKSFDSYIDTSKNISVTPANNLAVQKLTFTDKKGADYLADQFAKKANREYGKTVFTDTDNLFSQGEFNVQTEFSVSPLRYVEGTGLSGSISFVESYAYTVGLSNATSTICGADEITVYQSRFTADGSLEFGDVLYYDANLQQPVTNYLYVKDTTGGSIKDVYQLDTNNGEITRYAGICENGVFSFEIAPAPDL